MYKKNALLIFSIIIFVVAAVLGVSLFLKQMENPAVCSRCHAMKPYYDSYSNPQDYPLIRSHKNESISCIDCHSAPGMENRDEARMTIVKMIVSYIYTGNATADTSPLTFDCVKCHEIDTTFGDTEINPHAGVQSCEVSCHRVHENLILGDFMKMDCAECHVEPDVGGRHANVDCVGCHPIHGQIPSCTGCHASHDGLNVKVENSECLECHGGSAHTITGGMYDELSIIQTDACGACHKEQYQKIINSMHGNMSTCVGCHPSHGAIRPCANCHQNSHLMAVNYSTPLHMPVHRFFSCTDCHNVGGGIHKACIDCHIIDPHSI